jgi:hypothetical protein
MVASKLFAPAAVVAFSLASVLVGCAPESPFASSTGGSGPGSDPKQQGQGICIMHNCHSDDECGSCDSGRNTCKLDEGRCVACDAQTKTGCPDGETCSSWGNCVPAGLECPTDAHGVPQISCTTSADCAACDPMHLVCDPSFGKCVACTSSDTSACMSTDQCVNDSCSAKCPASCTSDNECGECGTAASPAHACNAHKCAECSPTYACPAGKTCSAQGTCEAVCGSNGAGACDTDADCAGCAPGTTTCHKPINGGAGKCGPTAAGCSDLGQGTITLPSPFNQVTNTCSSNADCAGVGVDFNVGKMLRDLTGFGDIHDASIVYGMNVCAGVSISDKMTCGVCVPCKVDSDCQDLDIDQVSGQAFGPLGSLAAAFLLDQIFGPSEHKVYMHCDNVAGDYGVCAPCAGLIENCKVGGGGSSGSGGGTGSGGGGTCDHDVCTSGAALDGGCDSCAASVCANDSYCCSTAWDSTCISEAGTYCGQTCGGSSSSSGTGGGSSSSSGTGGGNPACHDECVQGAALDASCNGCVQAICAQDSYCCNTAWDSVCIGHVNDLCNPGCP